MTLRQKYILYLVVLHIVFLATAAFLLREHRIWLFAVEAALVASAIVGWRLAVRLTEPLEFIRAGVEMLAASDFTTRFTEVDRPEVDRLIRLYNRMVDHLREERTQNQEQEFFLQRILEVSPAGMITLDLDGRIQSANPAAREILGNPLEPLQGLALEEVDSALGPRLAALADGRPRVFALGGRRRIRCRRLQFIDRGFSRSFLLMDELTRELHASEKAAYDKLIRVMSHEINNTSAAVISLLESCLNYADQVAEPNRTDFSNALTVAAGRTQHMNDFMRAFADVVRLPEPRKSPQDLASILETVRVLYQPQLDQRNIEWVCQLAERFPSVSLDRSQFEQVVLNIVKNAMEAIGSEGKIVLRTIVPDSGRPRLEIEDTGGGIPVDVQERLFTSFFTNKKTGQGIGLTLVQEILLGHGFDYSLETSAPGRARFTIGL